MTPERSAGYQKELRLAAKHERFGHYQYVSAQHDTELLAEKTAEQATSYDELEQLFFKNGADPELRVVIDTKLQTAHDLATREGDDSLRLKAQVTQASVDAAIYSETMNNLRLTPSELRRAKELVGLGEVREATIEAAREGLALYHHSLKDTRRYKSACHYELRSREFGTAQLSDGEFAELQLALQDAEQHFSDLKGFIQEETFGGLMLRHQTAAQYAVRSFVYDDMIEEITGHHTDYQIYDNRRRRTKRSGDVQIKSHSNELYYDDHITVLDATHLGNSYRTDDWPHGGYFQTLQALIDEYDGEASDMQKRTLDTIQQRVIRLIDKTPLPKPLPDKRTRSLFSAARQAIHLHQ